MASCLWLGVGHRQTSLTLTPFLGPANNTMLALSNALKVLGKHFALMLKTISTPKALSVPCEMLSIVANILPASIVFFPHAVISISDNFEIFASLERRKVGNLLMFKYDLGCEQINFIYFWQHSSGSFAAFTLKRVSKRDWAENNIKRMHVRRTRTFPFILIHCWEP